MTSIWHADVGLPPKLLADKHGLVTELVADDSDVWWISSKRLGSEKTTEDAVFHVPCRGGAVPVKVASVPAEELRLDAAHVYFQNPEGDLLRVAKSERSATPTTVAKLGKSARNITLDATHVYFLDAIKNAKRLVRVPKTGGEKETLLDHADAFTLDDDAAYVWQGKVLVRIAKSGDPSPTVIVDRPNVKPQALVDKGEVFFLEGTSVEKAPCAGGPRVPLEEEAAVPLPTTDNPPAACTGKAIDLVRALAAPECRVSAMAPAAAPATGVGVDVKYARLIPSAEDPSVDYTLENQTDAPLLLVFDLKDGGRSPYEPRLRVSTPGVRAGTPTKHRAKSLDIGSADYPCSFGIDAALDAHVTPVTQAWWAPARGFIVLPPHGRASGTVTWKPVAQRWSRATSPPGTCFASVVDTPAGDGVYQFLMSFPGALASSNSFEIAVGDP